LVSLMKLLTAKLTGKWFGQTPWNQSCIDDCSTVFRNSSQ
jgi:hypothetical protein